MPQKSVPLPCSGFLFGISHYLTFCFTNFTICLYVSGRRLHEGRDVGCFVDCYSLVALKSAWHIGGTQIFIK